MPSLSPKKKFWIETFMTIKEHYQSEKFTGKIPVTIEDHIQESFINPN